MRRTTAAFLFVCLGIIIPLAASPVRLCLLEHRLVVECGSEKSPCCPDCGDHHEDSCCMELDDLPDVPAPSTPEGLQPVAVIDLPPPIFNAPPAVLVKDAAFNAAIPIRGPDSPAAYRALLEIWRL